MQVHQTKYLTEIGFSATDAAWALGLVSLVAVPGQIALGHLSDRIGREWVWAIGNAGFVVCCLALILLAGHPTMALLWVMVVAQGTLGYGLTSVMGPIPAEIFAGRHAGGIFGMVMLSAILGGAAGPWVAGAAARPDRQLCAGVLDLHRPQRRLGGGDLAGGAGQGAGGRRADRPAISSLLVLVADQRQRAGLEADAASRNGRAPPRCRG